MNNAGYGSVGAVEEIAMPELEQLHATMFLGPLALMKAVLPHMRARRAGVIVQISSMGGQLAPPGFGAYCSAKFALEAMSGSLAAEVGPLGIRVLIVDPGRSVPSSAPTGCTQPDDHRRLRGHRRSNQHGGRSDGRLPTRRSRPSRGRDPGRHRRRRPPLRLALGDDAVDAIRAKHDQLRADLDGWEHVSRSTTLVRA